MNAVVPNKRQAQRPGISLVVPAFNEAGNLPLLLPGATAALRALTERWEILVVDDGSRDGTAALMQRWVRVPGVRYLRLSRNFGKEAALSAGLDRAAGEVVVLMDADGQHPLALLAPMLDAWREGADMVSAVRSSRADESLAKRLGTRLFYRLANAGSPVHIPEDVGDFRLMDRRVVEALKALPERNRFMKGLYAWVGFETRTLPYTPGRRQTGRSSFSLRRLMRLALTGITAFSNLPLRVWSGVGAVIAVGALAYGVWVVIEHFIEGHPVPGYATLVAGLMFFSGVQLLSIGILGEYVGRIFDEVKHRPLYVIGDEAGQGHFAPAPQPTASPANALVREPSAVNAPQRVLAVCADDFGLSPAVARGIGALAQRGRLTAVSCLTGCAAWPESAAQLADLPASVERGLHFNLTEGGPLSAELRRHWPRLPRLPVLIAAAHLGRLPLAAIACEWQAQWQAFVDATGALPAFVDGHQHVHHLPGVRDAVLAATPAGVALRNTGCVRGPGNGFKRWLIERTGGRALQQRLRAQGRAHNVVLLGVYGFDAVADYRRRMQGWLAAAPAQGGLLFCHPAEAGTATDAADAADAIAAARRREAAYLGSTAFADDLAAAGVTLGPAWRQRPSAG